MRLCFGREIELRWGELTESPRTRCDLPILTAGIRKRK
jgi:hypothetical protein